MDTKSEGESRICSPKSITFPLLLIILYSSISSYVTLYSFIGFYQRSEVFKSKWKSFKGGPAASKDGQCDTGYTGPKCAACAEG